MTHPLIIRKNCFHLLQDESSSFFLSLQFSQSFVEPAAVFIDGPTDADEIRLILLQDGIRGFQVRDASGEKHWNLHSFLQCFCDLTEVALAFLRGMHISAVSS